MAKRAYALFKLAKGDYLQLSNDGETLWRLTTYEDGPSHGLEGMKRDQTFWGIWKWTKPFSRAKPKPSDFEQWDLWDFHEGFCKTRAEAQTRALEMS